MTAAAAASPSRRVVCHLIERLEHGGAEALVHTLASKTASGNYASIVCCLQPGRLTSRFAGDCGLRRAGWQHARSSVAFDCTPALPGQR